jgi:hypothetical protein
MPFSTFIVLVSLLLMAEAIIIDSEEITGASKKCRINRNRFFIE